MQRKFYRINHQIQTPQLRLLDGKGVQIGLVTREEALKRADEEGVDLVEIAPNAKPPVCKLIDYKKFLYQEQKRLREEKRKSHGSETKEIRLGPFMSEHDLQIKIDKAKEFLKDGDKVRVVVKFTGRQMAHPEFGHKTFGKFFEGISTIAKLDREPKFEGRMLIGLFSPSKSGTRKDSNGQEAQNQEVNNKTV